MAITQFTGGFTVSATTDVVAGPVFLNSIIMVAGATSGLTTVRCNGTAGDILYSAGPPANDTVMMSFATPTKRSDLCVTAIGTNVTVNFLTE